jgi:protein XRP2
MGCVLSKAEGGDKYKVQSSTLTSPSKGSDAPASGAKKLDPKDFIFQDRKGETLVKSPGTIDGQQFVLDTCEDCQIYLLDTCDSVMIDDCKRCKIVVGPTTGSVFLRDCESCVVVVACRQFRTRDCVDIDTRLLVATRPIIETSAKMRFGCFDFHYHELGAQLKASGMTPYSNFWSRAFNFNDDTHPDWSLVSADATSIDALAPLPDVPALAGIEETLKSIGARGHPPVCFRTWGERGPRDSSGEGCLVLVPEADEPAARAIVAATAGKAELTRTNSCALEEAWLAAFLNRGVDSGEMEPFAGFASAECARLMKALARGKCVGLEFGGEGCAEAVRPVAEAAGFPIFVDPNLYEGWRYKGVEG